MNMQHQLKSVNSRQGIAPLILIIIIALVAAAAGGAGYFVYRSSAKPAGQETVASKKGETTKAPQAANDVDSLKITAPEFAVPSSSPMPALEASALNVTTANLPGKGAFRDFTANTDTSYSYKLEIPLPELKFDVPTETAPAGGATGGSTGGSTAPSAATCGQFSSIPSAQYCSNVPDPNGRALCEQCKAAGL